MLAENFRKFIEYVTKHITGDEKGEAQVFLDRFFMALGYPDGFKGAGANCEFRIHNEATRTTRFADLVWKLVVLIEMKKKDEDLSIHLQQAFSDSTFHNLQDDLDHATLDANGFDENQDLLEQILALNLEVACKEERDEPVQAPGLPGWYSDKEKLISDDCVRFES